MLEIQEVTFSDLIQRPTETVEKLKASQARALRLNRRGNEDDLVLTTAARAAQDGELVDVAARLLRAIMSDPVLRSKYVMTILPKVFPWMRFLIPEDQTSFVQEFIDTMEAGEEVGSSAPVLQLIAEWRHTAQIYADPELLEALRSQSVGDVGAVPAPRTR
jgi:hypothetical protein